MEYENCLGRTTPAGYSKRNPVTFIVNNWFGSAINGHIAKIILEEAVGVQTILMSVDNQTENWPLLASGDAHVALEIWATDSKEYITDFVRNQQTVVPAGPLGIIGEIGWYIPRYVQDDVPEVLFGQFSDEDAAYFNHTFYLGSPEWSSYDQQIIDYFNWSLTIQNLSGEDALLQLILAKYSKQQPVLFYFWKPHPLHDIIDLVKIQLKDATIDDDRHPWYIPDILEKFVWSGLADYSYEASFFANGFTYSNIDQSDVMAELLNGSPYTKAACNWVKNHEAIWKMWVAPVEYQEVPQSLQIAMLVLASTSIAVTIFYLVVTLVKRNTKVIVAASGTFLMLMCIGGFFIYGSVIAWATNTTEGCAIFEWFLPTGFALLFGSLFAKNARIYMLFSNKSLQVVSYSDRDIGLVVMCLVLIEWGILTAAQVLQGASYAFVNYGNAQYSFCIYHPGTGIALLVFNAS
jgi:glycine betaine/proline transport system substrate-binding protein